MNNDNRLQAFCSPEVLDCFQSIVHESEIWKVDPYDVDSIHSHARDTFERLLRQVGDERGNAGKIWLLKGESGAGKTHLMRVFRHALHDAGLGYFSYMQMTSAENNYPRYILRHTLDSLDKPYADDPTGSVTGLMRLSRALAEDTRAVSADELRTLREAELTPDAVIDLVYRLTDKLVALDDLNGIDSGLIRALLFLQRDDDLLKRRVMSYLRCEDLSMRDRQWLDMPARTADDDPLVLLKNLALLIWALDAGVLVICLDQLEYLYRDDADAAERFRNAVQAVNALVSHCPRLLVLVSCLEDYYVPLRQQLTASEIDRIEHDPAPTTLSAYLDREAIRALVARRLEILYDYHEVAFDERQPLYPFPDGIIAAFDGLRIRDLLNRCRELREQSITTKQAPLLDAAVPPDPAPTVADNTADDEALLRWDQRWNDFLTQFELPLSDDAADSYRELSAAISHCSDENLPSLRFTVQPAKHGLVVDVVSAAQAVVNRRFISLCNKSAVGGALGKQLREAEQAAGTTRLVVVRNTAFPANPSTKIAQQIVDLLGRGAIRVVIEDSDWRAMAAMREFKARHQDDRGFDDWLTSRQPLSLRPSLKTLLGLEQLPPPAAVDTGPASPPVEAEAPAGDTLQLGLSREFKPRPVALDVQRLTRHAAFLGGSGSGKTTLALTVIEQLLQRGVPALLLDRKGDLASYAQAAWVAQQPGSSLDPAVTRLLDQLDIALYTPGNTHGRPLGIPVIPKAVGQLKANERGQMAHYAALALGGMMDYKETGQTKTRLAILGKAIDVLAELSADIDIGLDDLIEFIASESPELINAIGQLDTKHFKKLVEDLETLRLMNGALFAEHGELLDCQALFGLDEHRAPGRTRLTIVNIGSLGGDAKIIFWVAQLLMALGRYAQRHPKDRLQCVMLLDEADLYLPASGKPATKQPLENLLRRARSAGIGLLLATQSPGDLDYKSRDQITTWLLGKIAQPTALSKLRPMLSEAKVDVETKLPGQETGQFYVISDGQVESLSAQASLIKAEQLPENDILQLAARLRQQSDRGDIN